MKWQEIVLIIVGIIMSLMIGSFLFGISCGFLHQDALVEEIKRLYSHRFITFIFSVLLYYLGYVVTRTLIKRATREEIFIAEGDFGRISVSLLAIRNIVKKVLRRFDVVKKYKLNLFTQNKKLVLKILVREWEGENISEQTARISAELKQKLHKITGLEGNIELNLKVEGINGMQ